MKYRRRAPMEKEEPITPLPKMKLAGVCAVVVSQSFCSNILFPFVGFMVEDLGNAHTKEEVGYYAGYLASAFFLGQVLSGYPSGYLADRLGRRPMLLAGLVASGTTIVLFGFSTNYALAIVYRALGGMLDSTVPTIKAYLGDITDHTNKARGFSFYGLTWGLGGIVGPVVGGLLAQPALKYPAFFSKDGLFGVFPYALPCVVSGILAALSLVISFFILPESMRKYEEPTDIEMSTLTKKDALQLNESEETVEKTAYSALLTSSGEVPVSTNGGSVQVGGAELQEGEEVPLVEAGSSNGEEYQPVQISSDASEEEGVVLEEEELDDLEFPEKTKRAGLIGWLQREHSLVGAIGAYLMTCLVFVGAEEVFPLWCMADTVKGGLSFTTSDIGWILLGGGIALVGFQAFLYTALTKIFGIRNALLCGLILGSAFVALFPSSTIFYSVFSGNDAYTRVWIFVFLEALIILKTAAATCCFTSTNIFVNLAAPKAVGQANGVAFMLAGVVKALGPTVGTNVLAWSLNNSLPFPLDYHLVFILLATSGLCGVLFTMLIDKNLENRD